MKKTKTKIFYIKAVILIICFIITVKIFSLALAKYETEIDARANIDVAFYLLKEDYQTMNLNLDSILPQDNEYEYYFKIGNQDGEKTADLDLQYSLGVRTTTNLPLTYELYEIGEDSSTTDVVVKNEVKKDEHGTYFRYITTEDVELKYTNPKTIYYKLVVKFPKNYNSISYQDIIELIEISVKSEQIV